MNTFLKSSAKVFALLLAAAPLTAALHAQNVAQRAQVKVPFAFEVGTKHLAAGVYTVQMEQGHVVWISGAAGSALTIAQPDENSASIRQGKIVFRRYGSEYFLREVWVSGSSQHFNCVKSKTEKDVQMASLRGAPSDVEIAQLEIIR